MGRAGQQRNNARSRRPRQVAAPSVVQDAANGVGSEQQGGLRQTAFQCAAQLRLLGRGKTSQMLVAGVAPAHQQAGLRVPMGLNTSRPQVPPKDPVGVQPHTAGEATAPQAEEQPQQRQAGHKDYKARIADLLKNTSGTERPASPPAQHQSTPLSRTSGKALDVPASVHSDPSRPQPPSLLFEDQVSPARARFIPTRRQPRLAVRPNHVLNLNSPQLALKAPVHRKHQHPPHMPVPTSPITRSALQHWPTGILQSPISSLGNRVRAVRSNSPASPQFTAGQQPVRPRHTASLQRFLLASPGDQLPLPQLASCSSRHDNHPPLHVLKPHLLLSPPPPTINNTDLQPTDWQLPPLDNNPARPREAAPASPLWHSLQARPQHAQHSLRATRPLPANTPFWQQFVEPEEASLLPRPSHMHQQPRSLHATVLVSSPALALTVPPLAVRQHGHHYQRQQQQHRIKCDSDWQRQPPEALQPLHGWHPVSGGSSGSDDEQDDACDTQDTGDDEDVAVPELFRYTAATAAAQTDGDDGPRPRDAGCMLPAHHDHHQQQQQLFTWIAAHNDYVQDARGSGTCASADVHFPSVGAGSSGCGGVSPSSPPPHGPSPPAVHHQHDDAVAAVDPFAELADGAVPRVQYEVQQRQWVVHSTEDLHALLAKPTSDLHQHASVQVQQQSRAGVQQVQQHIQSQPVAHPAAIECLQERQQVTPAVTARPAAGDGTGTAARRVGSSAKRALAFDEMALVPVQGSEVAHMSGVKRVKFT